MTQSANKINLSNIVVKYNLFKPEIRDKKKELKVIIANKNSDKTIAILYIPMSIVEIDYVNFHRFIRFKLAKHNLIMPKTWSYEIL